MDNLHALTDILQCLHICVHTEAVQNMSGQSALLRIHRSNDGRAHLMAAADTVTLYIVNACTVGIQHCCQQLLTQQVCFINIKNIIRSTRQNARGKAFFAQAHGSLQINAAKKHILCYIQWQRQHPLRTNQTLHTARQHGFCRTLGTAYEQAACSAVDKSNE